MNTETIHESEALHLERLDYLRLREGMHGTVDDARTAAVAFDSALAELAQRYGIDSARDQLNLRTREIRRGVPPVFIAGVSRAGDAAGEEVR